MAKVSEVTPLLYHYTTAEGLRGIVESQQIHATNIAYLNDQDEHKGYFVHRLPALLKQCLDDAYLTGLQTNPSAVRPSDEDLVADSKNLSEAMWSATARLHDPYVASFSVPPDLDHEDGLLSQWRGYGRDGGYAIASRTADIESLLEREYRAFHQQYLALADVEYYDDPSSGDARHPETIRDEELIKDAMKRYVLRRDCDDRSALDDVSNPITSLSVRHKHRGFREEAEVRIVALRSVAEVWEQEKANGEPRPQRELLFKPRGGLLVPYIRLFGKDGLGNDTNLPISKVIVDIPNEKRGVKRSSVFSARRKWMRASLSPRSRFSAPGR